MVYTAVAAGATAPFHSHPLGAARTYVNVVPPVKSPAAPVRTSADVIVVGLIGERGREVKEFIENILGAEGLARAVVVAAPAQP